MHVPKPFVESFFGLDLWVGIHTARQNIVISDLTRLFKALLYVYVDHNKSLFNFHSCTLQSALDNVDVEIYRTRGIHLAVVLLVCLIIRSTKLKVQDKQLNATRFFFHKDLRNQTKERGIRKIQD